MLKAFARLFTTGSYIPLACNTIHDNKGARKKHLRLGRGASSGGGRYCGRGMKGYKARSGHSIHPRYEGGQTPIWQRLPLLGDKRTHRSKQDTQLPISQVLYYIAKKELNVSDKISLYELYHCGAVNRQQCGVMLTHKVYAYAGQRVIGQFPTY